MKISHPMPNPKFKIYQAPRIMWAAWWFLLFFALIAFPLMIWLRFLDSQYNNGCFCFYDLLLLETLYAVSGIFIFKMINRKIRVDATGISFVRGKIVRQTLLWNAIAQIKGGRGRLELLDKSGKTKVPVDSIVKDFNELRLKIFEEWQKRATLPKLPLEYTCFPGGRLTVTSEGIQIKSLFGAKAFSWKQMHGLTWSSLCGRGGGRQLCSVKIVAVDGSVLKTFGPMSHLAEIYLKLEKLFIKRGKTTSPILAPKKYWAMLLPFAILGFLAMTFPGVWLGYFSQRTPDQPILWFGILISFLAFLYPILIFTVYRSPAVPEPGPKRMRFFTKAAAFAFGILFAWYFWLGLGKFQLHFVKKDILQAGYSFTPPADPPRLPDEQNGVYYFKKALTADSAKSWRDPSSTLDGNIKYNNDPKTPWNRPFYKKTNENDFLSNFQRSVQAQSLTPEQITYARKLVKEHAESLALIHQGALIGKYDWGQVFGIPWFGKVKLPRITFLLFEARLAGCNAYLLSIDGHYEKSLESLRDGFAIAEAARSSRFLIGELIGEAIPKMLLDDLRIMPSPIPASLLKNEILPALSPWETGERLPETINFEFFIMHGDLNQMSWSDLADYFHLSDDDFSDRSSPANYKDKLEGFFYRPFLEWSLTDVLSQEFRMASGLQLPPQERKAFFEKLDDEYHRNGWSMDDFYLNLYNIQTKADECVADGRIAHAAVEAKAFHEKNKRWPDAAWELEDQKTKTEFLDPFNPGADLKIMRYGDGILIYSLGPLGIDDQGRPKSLSTNIYTNTDLRWILK